MSEETERLNKRWWDLEQEDQARGDTQYLAVVRSNISREREAFQDKTNLRMEKYRKRLFDIYGGHISRYARNSPPTSERRWVIPHLLPDDFATDQEELPVDPYPLFGQVPEDPRTAVAGYH